MGNNEDTKARAELRKIGDEARDRFLESLKGEYPALFATPEAEEQFRAAADFLVTKTVKNSRNIHLRVAFENLRNYLLQDIELWQDALTKDQVLRAEYAKFAAEDVAKFVVSHMRLSYLGVGNAFLDIVEGTNFQDPASCDCEFHRGLREPKRPVEVVDAADMTDEDMDTVINHTKGSA